MEFTDSAIAKIKQRFVSSATKSKKDRLRRPLVLLPSLRRPVDHTTLAPFVHRAGPSSTPLKVAACFPAPRRLSARKIRHGQ
jgi:hypothetical protein